MCLRGTLRFLSVRIFGKVILDRKVFSEGVKFEPVDTGKVLSACFGPLRRTTYEHGGPVAFASISSL